MKRFLLSPYEIVKSAQAGGWDEVGRCKAGNDQRTKRTGEQLGMVMLFPHLLDVTDLHEAKKWACALARRPGRRHHGRVAQVIRAAARTAVRYAGRSRLCATSAVVRSLAGPQMTSVEPGPALQAHTVSLNSGAASPVFPHPHRATYCACSAVSHERARRGPQGEERTSLRAGSAGLKRNANLSRAGLKDISRTGTQPLSALRQQTAFYSPA